MKKAGEKTTIIYKISPQRNYNAVDQKSLHSRPSKRIMIPVMDAEKVRETDPHGKDGWKGGMVYSNRRFAAAEKQGTGGMDGSVRWLGRGVRKPIAAAVCDLYCL